MKIRILAILCLAALAARADDTTKPAGTGLVTNNHGGYNVVQTGAHKGINAALFGRGGFASYAYVHRNDKTNFILIPTVQDMHGQKVTVYRKIYFNTPEEAEAAKVTMKY